MSRDHIAHTGFALDERLRKDCFYLGQLPESHLLLMNNALIPWLILVPETEETELYQLPSELQQTVYAQMNALCRFTVGYFVIEKMNVAAIGNIVRQLHIHLVGRRTSDPCWPGVVWGCQESKPYPNAEVVSLQQALQRDFSDFILEPL